MRRPTSRVMVLSILALSRLLPQQATTTTRKRANTVDLAAPHDGTMDASPAIQAAVKSVGANGLRLRVRDSRYVLHSPVLVPSNVSVEGAGPGAEFITDVAGSLSAGFSGPQVSGTQGSGNNISGLVSIENADGPLKLLQLGWPQVGRGPLQ